MTPRGIPAIMRALARPRRHNLYPASPRPIRTARRTTPPHRSTSTLTPQPSTTSPPATPASTPAPRRPRLPWIYATTFLFLGLATGQLVRLTVIPPPLPVPGSDHDAVLLDALHAQADALPIVRELRAHAADWKEWPAYSAIRSPHREHRLSTGPMAGARGLGVQRVFWNEREQRAISVMYFGGGLSGWPGVVHGGTVATVMDESLGRVAIRQLAQKTGVTANLELSYRAPTLANRFYILRAEVDEAKANLNTDRKKWVKGVLEEVGTGKVCVEAKGLFVTPKGVKLTPFEEGF